MLSVSLNLLSVSLLYPVSVPSVDILIREVVLLQQKKSENAQKILRKICDCSTPSQMSSCVPRITTQQFYCTCCYYIFIIIIIVVIIRMPQNNEIHCQFG